MKHIYSSIDISTDTIKLIVCELYNNRLNLLAASSVKSKGIKKGLIVDPNEATISIRQAFDEVESMLGVKINQVITTVPSYFTEYNVIKGQIEITNEDNMVTGDDIVNVLDKAMDSKKEVNRAMVNILPIDFIVDDNERVKDPKGLTGRILSTRAVMATVPIKNIYSVVGLLNNMGIEVADISLGSVGDIYAFKNKELDGKIGCVINIGHETTTISLYNKGVPVKSSIICMGSKNVTNDLAYMYKIDVAEANKVKEKFTLAHKKHANVNDFYGVTLPEYNEILKINQYEASEIVMARINEILELANKEIKTLTSHEIEYIILTGGISNMAHFEYCLEDNFGSLATIGEIKTMGIRNNKYSSALGNIIYFINKLRLKGIDTTMVGAKASEQISTPHKGNTNVSILGKVFGYFMEQ